MTTPKFYAVVKGRKPGIYKTWQECQAQVMGFSGAQCKSFLTYREAMLFAERASRSLNVAPLVAPIIRLPSPRAVAGNNCTPRLVVECDEESPSDEWSSSDSSDSSDYSDSGDDEGSVLSHPSSTSAVEDEKDTPRIKLENDEQDSVLSHLPNSTFVETASTHRIKMEEPTPTVERQEDEAGPKRGTIDFYFARIPRPSSQSYFAESSNFKPDAKAPFEHEFNRFMSSQGFTPDDRVYRRERTAAISHELKFHYSQRISEGPEEDPREDREEVFSDEQKLKIYQEMCREVDLEPQSTIESCVYNLRFKVLVNIPDFIDVRRLGRKVKVWSDFASFKKYTLRRGKRMDVRVARENGGFLAVLLRRFGDKSAATMAKRKRERLTETPVKRLCKGWPSVVHE